MPIGLGSCVPSDARRDRAYSLAVEVSYRTAIVPLVGGVAMAAVAGWPTGFLWLFWFIVARVGAQRFSGWLSKFWPIISAVVLATVVLGLRAAL